MAGVAWSVLSRSFGFMVGLAVTIVLARLLAPRDYGLLAMALVFIGIAQQVRDFGVGQALVQLERVTAESQQLAFGYALAASSLMYVLLFALAPWVAAFYGDPEVTGVLRVLALSFPITAFAVVPTAMLRRNLTLRGEAIANTVSMLVDSIVTIALAAMGHGVWALVAGKVLGVLALAVSLAFACPWAIGLRFRGAERRRILTFGGGLTATSLLWYAYTNADFLIVGRVLGSSALGVYTMAWNVAKLPWDRLWTTLNPLVLPLFSRARSAPRELGEVLCRVTLYICLVTFPAVAGLGAVADDIVGVLLGPKWVEAVHPLVLLSVLGIARGVAVLWAPVLLASGRVLEAIRFNVICVVVLPIGFLVGTQWGILGVAFAWAALYPVLSAVLLLPQALATAEVPLRRYLGVLAVPAAAAALMVVAVVLAGTALPLEGAARLTARVAVGALVYVGAIRLIHGPFLLTLRDLWAETRAGIAA